MNLILGGDGSGSTTTGTMNEIVRQVESYFAELLTVEQDTNGDLATALKVSVGVEKESWTAYNTITLESAVDVLYRSNTGWPIILDEVLEKLVAQYSNKTDLNFYGYPVVAFDFHAVPDKTKTLFVEVSNSGDAKSATEKGLIVATSSLMVILVAVSFVLLYITGGWDAFKQAMTNCLFEEVEDENYLTRSKSKITHSTDAGNSSDSDGRVGVMQDVNLNEKGTKGSDWMSPSGMMGALMPVTKGQGNQMLNGEDYDGNSVLEASAVAESAGGFVGCCQPTG